MARRPLQTNATVTGRVRLLKEAFQLLWALAVHAPLPLRDMAQGTSVFNTMVRQRGIRAEILLLFFSCCDSKRRLGRIRGVSWEEGIARMIFAIDVFREPLFKFAVACMSSRCDER